VVEGKRRAGAAVVDGKQVIWASSLPEGTSAQKAELQALTQALELAEGKAINIYTDSRYAFATAHIHGAIYRQRGLLTSAGKEIKNKEEILALLEAIYLPKRVAIVHCPGHQKSSDPVAKGNQMADWEAKQAAQGAVTLAVEAIDEPHGTPEVSFEYTPKDYDIIEDMGDRGLARGFSQHGVAKTKEGKIIMPYKEGRAYVERIHRLTHLGAKKLCDLIQSSNYYVIKLHSIAEQVAKTCKACALTNAARPFNAPGKRLRGDRPGAYWEIDFAEIKPGKYGNKHLLVFIDTFSGWVEAFPTKSETAQVVTKKILEEILPRFGIPKVIGSDNGPLLLPR
jgi:ribonuclease HI